MKEEQKPPLPLGTKTEWGTIEAVGITGGERYYWMVDKLKVVSMMPAFMVEDGGKDAEAIHSLAD